MPKPDKDIVKEKFRPDVDSALDAEIEAALGAMSDDQLYGDAPQTAAESATAAKGTRRGRIVSIGKDDVFVDFGGKSQGIASLQQFNDEEMPTVGQELEFNVDRYDGREGVLVLTRKGAKAGNVSWETLEAGQVVEGTVTGVNKGGLEIDVKGMRAFMPAGQVDIYHVPDLSQFINQKMTAEVTQFDRGAKNIVLSRRNLLEVEREEKKKKLLTELAPEQIRRGTIRSVMDFGAFVDLGGVDGLLHVSELSFRRVRNATEVVKVGDVVDVKILKIDPDTGKISLSLKQARGIDPWSDAGAKYSPGSTVTGRVTKLETFGAFIEVEEGIEGLLPISEISFARIKHPSDVFKEGDTLKLVILSIDPVARRLSFSLKQAGPNPWAEAPGKYQVNTMIEGTVTRLAEFGAFVELEPGLEGLIHISELADKRIRTPGDVVKVGEQVKVRLMEVDPESRRISLSLKRGAAAPAAVAHAAEPQAPVKKKKRPELRGGLDF